MHSSTSAFGSIYGTTKNSIVSEARHKPTYSAANAWKYPTPACDKKKGKKDEIFIASYEK